MIIRKFRWSMSQPGNGMIEDDAVKDGWYRSPEVEAALAEKEEKIQAAMEAGKMLKEQRDKAEEEIVALTDENKQLRELVDCAEDIVELYGASRPGLTEDQEGWKKEWLRKARQALRGEEVGNEYY